MKYSHYIFFASHLNEAAFLRLVHDARSIVDLSPPEAMLCGEEGGPVVINNSMLIIGSHTNDSPFSKLRVSLHKAAPTGRYPLTVIDTHKKLYDLTICACLLSFAHHFPAASITSDGTLEDWRPAMELYSFATDRTPPKIGLQLSKTNA